MKNQKNLKTVYSLTVNYCLMDQKLSLASFCLLNAICRIILLHCKHIKYMQIKISEHD